MNHPNIFLSRRIALSRFRKKVPFLRLIPDDIYYALDFSNWYEPFGEIETYRTRLENTCNCYVMTHKECKKATAREKQLRARLEEPNLSDAQWSQFIAEMDAFMHLGIHFLPYAKPLTIIPLKDVLRHPCDPPDDYNTTCFEGVDPDEIPF